MTDRILISDPLEESGVEQLRASGADVVVLDDRAKLLEVLPEFDALVVRSGTKVTKEVLDAGKRLRVVGRAGIGVDNIDVAYATEKGVLVVNAPTANLLSATEHTFALLLALARKVPSADAALKEERWDRKSFVGSELYGKTLGIVGFGQIGQRVAARARAFEMKVLAFDPFLDPKAVRHLDVELVELDRLLAAVDVVTFHTPLTDQTRSLLNAERLALMKEGALVINCGRGGVIDEPALLEALESGHIGGAGLDVFASEPPQSYELIAHPKVVATPHIGAQTREAQERIASQIADMVIDALGGSLSVAAVNLPFRPAAGPSEAYLHLGERLGNLAFSLLGGSLSRLEVALWGLDQGLHVPVTVAALKGALTGFMGEAVNYVNAEALAADRGIEVVRSAHGKAADYPLLIGVSVAGEHGSLEVAGTLYNDGDARVVRVFDFRLEFKPKGRLLILRNRDVPGFVGRLGTLLGNAGVNIADIHLARETANEEALAVLRLDSAPDGKLLAAVRGLDEVEEVHVVEFGS